MEAKRLTVTEASRLLMVSDSTMRLWDKSGKLPAHRSAGNRRLYDLEQLRDFVAAREDAREIDAIIQKLDRLLMEG